ncbi:MAG: hypothetical protein LUQ11_05565 [Methylococcaceae bacterium]|nr:hypothetical protein [Methylococcaceae bacterium]
MKPLKNNNFKLATAGAMIFGALTGLLAPTSASATILSAASGIGTFTINFDREAFAALQGGNSTTPGIYTAHFYNTAESNYTSVALADMVNGGGMTEQPSAPLVHDITATGADPVGQAVGRHVKATSADFAFNTGDNSGTGTLGMTGAQKIALGAGPFTGSRMVYGDYSLSYSASQRSLNNNLSGWHLDNNIGWLMEAYYLANLNVSATDADNWKLTGDLLLTTANKGMIGGVAGSRMGGFCLGIGSEAGCAAVSTVPVPGAVWLFGSGLVGLLVSGRRKLGILA